MKLSNYLLICVIIVTQFSCKHKVESLTDAERKIVFSATAHTPFRVLQITDKTDSLTLRTDCSDLTNFVGDSAFTLLVERLKTTLETEDGVGIAAPQIGINKNLFLFIRLDLPDQPVVVAVNPKIINKPDSLVCFERDGCLSIPDFSG
ncbi:MAG: peptide deformylase, partial [Paludibacter sp.]|nr:peptide deformylase [Paludibacter sp.]